jgi:DHA2 family multidrug resistance protein
MSTAQALSVEPATQEAPRRGLITLAMMSSTVLVVLDMTIVNVALPHMGGELSASPEELSWVLTSYLVASAVFMPLTGYLTDRLGRKNHLLASIGGFVLTSMASGAATSLAMMIFFRILQGAFGASLVPLSQAVLNEVYPRDERGKAMAIWGMGVMLGPILGPTLGGWLTEYLSWRWIFYINLPVGVLSLLLAARVVPDAAIVPRKLDWAGLLLASLGIAAGQFVLDRGNEDGWFSSPLIVGAALVSLLALGGFVLYALSTRAQPIFNLRLFRDRNFAASSLIIAILGLGMFGALVVQPLMLESLLGYPALTTGLVMAPRGLASMAGMVLVGRFIRHLDVRLIIGTGMALAALGSHFMTSYDLAIDPWAATWPGLLQGLGMGLMMVPLSTLALSTLPPAALSEAAGLFSLFRTVGASAGIAVVETVASRHGQMAWNQLGGHIQPFNPALSGYLAPIHLGPGDPRGVAVLTAMLAQQAQMQAVLDVFQLVTWSFVAMLPLLLLLKGNVLKSAAQAPK